MKILAMHSTLIIIFSSILIACGASSGNDNKSANESSISKKIESLNNTLNTVFDSLPEASTGLPYSSHALDLSSSNNHLFHASGLPSWATLDSQTGQIHGIPDNKDAGVFDLNLSLSQNGLTVEKQIPLIVRHISAHKIADEIRVELAALNHFDPEDQQAIGIYNNIESYQEFKMIFSETAPSFISMATVFGGDFPKLCA